MLILSILATASAACTWTIPAADLGERALVAPDNRRTIGWLVPSDELVQAKLHFKPGAERMSATFTSEFVQINAEIAIDVMTYIGPPLAWGRHGTIHPGAGVVLVEMQGDSVVIVPKLAHDAKIIRDPAEVRVAVPCERLSPATPVPHPVPTVAPDPGELVHAATALAPTVRGERSLFLLGTRGRPLAFKMIAQKGDWDEYIHADAWGTSWTGWSSSTLEAPERYWREGSGGLSQISVGRGFSVMVGPTLVCRETVELKIGEFSAGKVLAGGRVLRGRTVVQDAPDVQPVVPWLYTGSNHWTPSSLASCEVVD